MDTKDVKSSLPPGENLKSILCKSTAASLFEATPQLVGKTVGAASDVITSKPAYIQGYDASGNPKKITPDALMIAEESTDTVMEAAMDGIFITYHRKQDGFLFSVSWWTWKSLENSGEIADGVLVMIDGQAPIVVAPNDVSSGMHWSASNTQYVNTNVGGSYSAAYKDYDGKTKCAAILANSVLGAESAADNAVVACNQYTRANGNGKGILAGQWWLPSIGELMMIWSHKYAINKALSQINGATPLAESWYWSCTERSAQYAWLLNLSFGYLDSWLTKVTASLHVRAVAAFH